MSDTKQAAERFWRDATTDDIGSIARFGDTTSTYEPWEYGILESIRTEPDSPTGKEFIWHDSWDEEHWNYVCQIQVSQ